MTKHNMNHGLARQLGYTIDQTILIVAVIAILVTMIIGSVGWDLLSRAGGTKLQSHLVQMENAAGSFFSQYGLWPTDVTDGGGDAIMALINKDKTTWKDFDPKGNFRNYLPNYEPGSGSVVQHPFGSGGKVTLTEESYGSGQTFLVFKLENVPSREYLSAEESIDGDTSAGFQDNGRLRTAPAGGGDTAQDPSADGVDNVTLEYYANVVY